MKKWNYKGGLSIRWSTITWELLLLAIFNFVLTSCDKEFISGSGVIVTETRTVAAFTDINAEGPFHIHLRQGTDGPVEITADDNLMRVIDTYVSGNTLRIRIKKDVRLRAVGNIDIYLQSAKYYSVVFAGAGSVESLDTLRSPNFTYRTDGSGNARFRIVTDRLDTEINGSGDLQLFGSATSFDSQISGSGNVSGLDLLCQDVTVAVKGSGNHTLSVSHSLDVSIRGSGDVRYKGNPSITKDIQGSGRVIKL